MLSKSSTGSFHRHARFHLSLTRTGEARNVYTNEPWIIPNIGTATQAAKWRETYRLFFYKASPVDEKGEVLRMLSSRPDATQDHAAKKTSNALYPIKSVVC